VSGPIGRFPLPPGAQLIEDGTDNGHYDIVFGSVSPSEASRFYTTALPRAGYTITSNSSAAGDSFSGTGIWFTGHGYNGQIGALSSFHISGISFGANTVHFAEKVPSPLRRNGHSALTVTVADLEGLTNALTAGDGEASSASPT
jgi:hypothetical protein